jgi:hypothetical protein
MMSVLPILFAAGLSEIKKYTKAGFYSIVLVILFSQGLGNFYLAKAWNDPLLVSEKLDLPDTKPLMKFLNEHNIKHAYAHFWISYRLTYETKEGVICSTPYNERYAAYKVPFIDEVKKSDNVAYILHNKLGLKEEYFEACMKEIGGSYKKQVIDELPEQTGKVPTGFVVYYDFEAPYKKVPLKEVARDNWRVSSNCNDKESSKATDGDINTRWGSACPQRPDIWFMIDLGGFHKIGKLCFEFGQYGTDFPHGYRVEVSEDGEKWKTVSDMPHAGGGLYWRGSHPVCFANGNTLTAAFPTIDARYVKIVQTGAHPIYDWSIAEVRVYEV